MSAWEDKLATALRNIAASAASKASPTQVSVMPFSSASGS